MPAPAHPKAAVFDMGGVLVDWNPDYLYRNLIPDAEARNHFYKDIMGMPEWQGKLDAGIPFDEAARELLVHHKGQPEVREWILAWGNRFSEMFNGPIQGTVDVLHRLENHSVPLFGLTNWSAESYARDSKQFSFFNSFEDIVVSGIEKVKKPEPRIYEILIDRAGMPAQDMVLIDDKQENLVPARALGFHTIHFTAPAALASTLQELHLL